MRAWDSVAVPKLPVDGPEVRVHDSASGELRPVAPQDGPARLYVCGITPYDATHMGHAATYVAFDLLNRAWRSAGHEVRYAQNVTDVDDPLLERANDTGDDWEQLAQRETQLFRDDMTALRVLPPDAYVGVVESIPLVVEMVERLQQTGAVYDVDGDLYFSVATDPTFGSVSGYDREQMLAVFAERGGDPERPGKKDALDCLLWRAERPGEPAWDSPFGRGRPGWHVECTAIAMSELGNDFDVQGGGNDLLFPHHEMCAAEAQCAAPDHRFARAYVHAGMVGLDGEKMSKSKGNLVKVSQLRAAGLDPMVVRLVLLGHHYRSDWSWEESDVSAAGARLDRWRDACAKPAGAATGEVVAKVLSLLAEDLDAPTALREIDHWADATVFGDTTEEGSGALMITLIDAVLGVEL